MAKARTLAAIEKAKMKKLSKYVPGQKLPTPTAILLYPCQNSDCDPGYGNYDNLHPDDSSFIGMGKATKRQFMRKTGQWWVTGAGFYCLSCLSYVGVFEETARPTLAEA